MERMYYQEVASKSPQSYTVGKAVTDTQLFNHQGQVCLLVSADRDLTAWWPGVNGNSSSWIMVGA